MNWNWNWYASADTVVELDRMFEADMRVFSSDLSGWRIQAYNDRLFEIQVGTTS